MSPDVLFYLAKLLGVLASTIGIYLFVLLVRVLLSWFPNLDWASNPALSAISSITDPYLNTFRGLIPPLGGLDLSAILAFIVLNLAQGWMEGLSAQLLNAIRKAGKPLLEQAELVDRYDGEQVAAGSCSQAFRLRYRDPKRTLKDVEVDEAHQKIRAALEKQFGAQLRA